MADKKITISAGLDTSDFDRKIQDIQRKLTGMTKQSDYSSKVSDADQRLKAAGYAGINPNAEAQKDKDRLAAVKDLDTYIKRQQQSETEIQKSIEKRTQKLDEYLKKNKEDLKTEEQKLAFEKEKTRQTQIIEGLKKSSSARISGIEEAVDLKERLEPAKPVAKTQVPQKTEGQDGKNMFESLFDLKNLIRGSIYFTAARMAAGVGTSISTMPRENEILKGQNIRTGAEQTAGTVFGGRLSEEMFFKNQRAKSIKEGSLTGMEEYSPFSKVGLLKGLSAATYSGEEGPSWTKWLKTKAEETYKSEQLSKQRETFEGIKNQSPLDILSRNTFYEKQDRNLQMQRSLGMQDNEFFSKGREGYFGKGFAAGFSDEQTLQASQGILSAGGTTRGAKDLATYSNQLQRNSVLTNANGLLGGLSGTGMANSQEALEKIMTKAMRSGLDTSKYAQEYRKYAEVTVDAINQSGARDSMGAGMIAGTMSGFTDLTSTRGVEAGKSAYDAFQNMTRSGSGPQNLIRQVGIDKMFKSLSGQQRLDLGQMSEQDLNAGGFEVQSMAQTAIESGEATSLEDFQKKVRGNIENSFTTSKKSEELYKKVKERYNSPEKRRKLQEQIKNKQVKDKEASSLMSEWSANTQNLPGTPGSLEREQAFMGYMGFDAESGGDKNLFKPEESTRMIDQQKRGEAKQSQAVFENMADLLPKLSKSMSDVNEMTREQIKEFMNLSSILAKEGTESVKEYTNKIQKLNGTMKDAPVAQEKGGDHPVYDWLTNKMNLGSQLAEPLGKPK